MIKLLENKDQPIEYKVIKSRPLDPANIFFVDYVYPSKKSKKRVLIGRQVFVIGK